MQSDIDNYKSDKGAEEEGEGKFSIKAKPINEISYPIHEYYDYTLLIDNKIQ